VTIAADHGRLKLGESSGKRSSSSVLCLGHADSGVFGPPADETLSGFLIDVTPYFSTKTDTNLA
jgi:hypothetical protein